MKSTKSSSYTINKFKLNIVPHTLARLNVPMNYDIKTLKLLERTIINIPENNDITDFELLVTVGVFLGETIQQKVSSAKWKEFIHTDMDYSMGLLLSTPIEIPYGKQGKSNLLYPFVFARNYFEIPNYSDFQDFYKRCLKASKGDINNY